MARLSETECTIMVSALFASSQMKPFDSPAFFIRMGTCTCTDARVESNKGVGRVRRCGG